MKIRRNDQNDTFRKYKLRMQMRLLKLNGPKQTNMF